MLRRERERERNLGNNLDPDPLALTSIVSKPWSDGNIC